MRSTRVIPSFRRLAAAAAVLAAMAVGVAVPWLVSPWMPDDTAPLPEVVARTPPGRPTLWIAVDPDCGACALLQEEMAGVVRPEELGVAVRTRERTPDDPPGLWPRLRLLGRRGRTLGAVRGYRPPHVLRRWLEDALARDDP